MKSNIVEKELICSGCNRAIQVEYNSRSRRLVRDTMCEHCGTMIQYITNEAKYEKAMKEIDAYSKDINALYEYAERADTEIQTYITTELEKHRNPRFILQEAQLLSETRQMHESDVIPPKEKQYKGVKNSFVQDTKTNTYLAQQAQEQKKDDSRKHQATIKNDITTDIKLWLSKNWAWLIFIGGMVLLLLLDKDDRASFFFILFLFPLGLLIWHYWHTDYDKKFKQLEQTKTAIDQRVQCLRTGKYAKMDFFMKLSECDKDYAALEVREEALKKQKERDITIVVSTLLLVYCFVLPIAIGFLGWRNIIEMLSF